MTVMDGKPPVGLRQHNPGNIRLSAKNKWQEALPPQPGDEFVRFKAPQWGIRAIAKIIINYDKRGISSPYDFAKTWAPPTENDTDAYAAHIAQALGVELYDYIDLDSFEVALPLIKTVILHENGRNPYKEKVIIEGLRMAGIRDAPPKKLIDRTAFKTQAVGAAGSVLSVAALVSEPAKKAADGLEPFTASPLIQQVTIGLVTLAGVAALAGMASEAIRRRKGL